MSVNTCKLWLVGSLLLLAGGVATDACATTGGAGSTTSKPLLDGSKIDLRQTTTLRGTVPLKVAKSQDLGRMGQTEAIPSMTLVLKRSVEQQKQFDAYLASLNNPASPNFHKWLTAKQVGELYGPDQEDVATVSKWLNSQGLGVKNVSPDRMRIRFTGSVGAVQRAFGTSMRRYSLAGKTHFANATEQKLPAALTSVVAGVASLTDFFPKPLVKNVQSVKRDGKGRWVSAGNKSSDFNFLFNNDVYYDLVPADFNVIYNVNPLWGQDTPVRGAGQTVAVLERTDVQDADVATFRQTFLPTNAAGVFAQVHPAAFTGDTSCADPGTNGDEGEAALDAEWAGAAAPDANVMLAACADTGADFGPFLAAQNLLAQDTPPAIMSLSYGECELVSAAVGDLDLVASIWAQAAAEGTTVFVSSGDAGAAACDQNESAASFGIAVNGLGSTPYNISVGGTDFNDFRQSGKYWQPANGNLGASALSYIPEQTWNSSCASSQLYAILGYADPLASCNGDKGENFLDTGGGGGGPSYAWSQPTWQTGIAGLSQALTRATPDVSLFAANGIYGHALIFCMSDASEGGTPCNYINPTDAIYNSAGGTSFAAPAMAGIQALVNQASNANHGNIGPTLYGLARKQYGTSASPASGCSGTDTSAGCIFHDVVTGDIDVPCFAGTGDCYVTHGNAFGVVSDGGTKSLATAWSAGKGYDYATGLGSINVTNLANAIAAQEARGKSIPRTWDLFGMLGSGNQGVGLNSILDGHSSLLMISQKDGSAIMLHMNGGTVLDINPWDSMFEPNDQVKAIPTDLFSGVLAGQTVMESDNPVDHTTNLAIYSYGWVNFRFAYPAGWTLVGSGVVDGSGISKEVWRNDSTGQLGYWTINCTGTIHFGQLFNMGCDRVIGGTVAAATGYTPRLADLNGDGYLDIVWTGPANDIYYWINDGQGNFTKSYGGTYPAGWTLEGAGEVTGSGKTDLIWTNTSTNQVGWWVMNGTTVLSMQVRSVAPGYSIASIEDFDGDGLADLLWTNSSGDAYVWQGTGTGFVSQHVSDGNGTLYAIPAGYVVQKNRLQGVTQAAMQPMTLNASIAHSKTH
ncbi:protease pro-enzyme activation domain-containing protein [Dyella sp. EPa41]|uniref:protease pro-enzyme activation domain-containing protein n=1 Tax=Dyella sp. EPa41 TaxID=1561194 RepID=UPI0019163B02|nr:protease pro-enzyme activation domain-containing protein [Dyella sp. EPa41]